MEIDLAVVATIATETLKANTGEDHSLCGSCGDILLLANNVCDNDNSDRVEELLLNVLNADFNDNTLCNGYAGVNFTLAYLCKSGFLEESVLQELKDNNKTLLKNAILLLESNNYDFLYGALGISYTCLYNYQTEDSEEFEILFQQILHLFKKSTTQAFIPDYDAKSGELIADTADLGLAHGITSLLKFAALCYQKDVCRDTSSAICRRIIGYLLANMNLDTSKSFWPSKKQEGDNRTKVSRLGWCYGDLTIAFVLFQAGKALELPDVTEAALNVLLRCSTRRTEDETKIYDAGICHGSSGVAYIFYKIWHYTKIEAFNDAVIFWTQKTLEMACHSDGIAGYKKYNAVSDSWENDSSLLEGTAGIGLVLNSLSTNNFGWDYCLMLNSISDDGTY